MAQANSFAEHMAYGVVDDIEGVISRIRKVDDGAFVIPDRQTAVCKFCVQIARVPFLKAFIKLFIRNGIGFLVDFYCAAVQVQGDVKFVFLLIGEVGCTFSFQYSACLVEVLHADIDVDVATHTAFRVGVVLCDTLTFQENRGNPFRFEEGGDSVYCGIGQFMDPGVGDALNGNFIDGLLLGSNAFRQGLHSVSYENWHGLLVGNLEYGLPFHLILKEGGISCLAPEAGSEEFKKLLLCDGYGGFHLDGRVLFL